MRIPHLPCPVLAVSVSNRGLAFVCLDAYFRLVGVRTYDLRRHRRTVDAKVQAVRAGVASAIREFAPASILVESDGQSLSTKTHDVFAATLLKAAAHHGLAASTAAFRDACLRIGGAPSSAKTVAILRGQYHVLALRLTEHPERALRNHDQYRRLRPLLGALSIAHASVLEGLAQRG